MRPVGQRGGGLARGGRVEGRGRPVDNARGAGKPTGDDCDGVEDYLADQSLLLLLFYFCYYHVLLILVIVYMCEIDADLASTARPDSSPTMKSRLVIAGSNENLCQSFKN